MSSNIPEKQTLEKDIEQRLSLKYDHTFLKEGGKSSLLLNLGLLGGPFVMAFLFLSYTSRNASLLPLIVAACVNGLWALLIALKHQSISVSDYSSLKGTEQSNRLLYDSSWVRTYRGGFLLFVSVVVIWSIVEIGLIMKVNIWFAAVYISSYVIGCTICILKRDWIAKIYVEGPDVHTWVNPMIRIFAVIGGSFIAMSGLARLFQATLGVESTQWIAFPILAIGLWPFAIAGFISSLLSFKIARVQYKLWQQNDSQKGSMSVENT